MRLAHKVTVSVFCRPEDDEPEVLNKLSSLFPFNLEESKIKIRQQSALGFNERRIRIFDVALEKERHCNDFLNYLKEKLSDEQRELLFRQRNSRLDEELNFFIRLDKDRLVREGRLFITDRGNCYHIKISVAAFPAKRETALQVLEKYLK